MSVVLDVSTAVPGFSISKDNLLKFYVQSLKATGLPDISKKLRFLLQKTKIDHRYSSIPDFEGINQELFINNNYLQPVERRMEIYKEKIIPLAAQAVDEILRKNKIDKSDVTHIITVSCTGLFAPGLEFAIAEHFNLQHTEKLALNYLGCYAAVKALKHAHYISQANPDACILIISAELCSLHFMPSVADEDIVANLLFADGAAAVIVCGDENKYSKNKVALNIDAIGSACIPNSKELMTWNISSGAFSMFLSKHLVNVIKENIRPAVNQFLKGKMAEIDFWAIHPGGIRIVEAVQESLRLSKSNVEDSFQVLQQYGNMSSPTILFILKRIFDKIQSTAFSADQNIFACAFGPGLSIEMIQFSVVDNSQLNKEKEPDRNYAIQD